MKEKQTLTDWSNTTDGSISCKCQQEKVPDSLLRGILSQKEDGTQMGPETQTARQSNSQVRLKYLEDNKGER